MKKLVDKNLSVLNNIKIAHRGLCNSKYPENSLRAYKACIDKKIPIELDVHILTDNTLVVIHDDNTERLTGKKVVLKNSNYQDIKDLRLMNTNEKIPTLKEVLNLVDEKVLLDIELKYDVKSFKICREICKYLDEYKGDFIIKSFNPVYVLWFRIFRSNYIRGFLISSEENKGRIFNDAWHTFLMWFNIFMKCDFIAFDYRYLPNKKIDRLYKKGVPVLLFTVNENDKLDYKYTGLVYEGE